MHTSGRKPVAPTVTKTPGRYHNSGSGSLDSQPAADPLPPHVRETRANRLLHALFVRAIDAQRDQLATTVAVYGRG